MKEEAIDAVLLWVDGNDPVLNAKRRRWAPQDALTDDNRGGKTRYADCGEVHYCVRSIRKFAPWIHRIYIITDGQDPGIEPGNIPVEIVDHTRVFAGYERFLPVFNSSSIESMLWRIPGLSRRFLYFNDDFFLFRPVRPSDFFTASGIVAYARPYSVAWARLIRAIRHDPGHFSFRGMMLNSALLMGEKRRFFRYDHTPRALLRDFYEDFFAAHPEALEQNIRYRFRSSDQFSIEELLYLDAASRGQLTLRSCRDYLFFWQCRAGKDQTYFEKKWQRLLGKDWYFAAINSMDKLPETEQQRLLDFLRDRLISSEPSDDALSAC